MAMTKASCAQFPNATALEHLHTLIRSEDQIKSVIQKISEKPGVVLHTFANPDSQKLFEAGCKSINIPCLSILDPTLSILARYLGATTSREVAAQRNLDSEYYGRIEALDYAMAHDDGQNIEGLAEADIILLGISRTSKTPTSIYLANRGLKAGNIPIVPNSPWPDIIDTYKTPFIVGLIASPARIAQIREQRLESLNAGKNSSYADAEQVSEEMKSTKRMFLKKGYPWVDVTRRSVEETAAKILNLYKIHKSNIL